MAENEGKSSTSVPWMPLLAMLAAVAGLTALLPSRSARPPAPSDTVAAPEPGKVSARLWQDPLAVAREAATRAASQPTGKKASDLEIHSGRLSFAVVADKPEAADPRGCRLLTETYRELAEKAAGKAPLVLVTCEPSSPYAEDVERRVRDRAGVIHALAAEGYLPNDSTALQYVTVDGRADAVLPFEGFHRLERTTQRAVLVVWLADGVLSKKGLFHQLAALNQELTHRSGALMPGGLVEVRVLGPSSSAEYRLMLEGAVDDDPNCPLGYLASTRIYSCVAEAPDEVLTTGIKWLPSDLEKGPPVTNAIEERMQGFGAAQFRLSRTICPADKLAAVLWKELTTERRVKENADVAVIAELDSLYGRSTTWAFLHARPGPKVERGDFNLDRARADAPHIQAYTYMAGLDGALPKNALGAEEQKAKDTDSTAKTAAPTEDPPEGLSQIDYLRRLADQLADEDRRLRREHADHQGLRAVAVLGSDTYDKLQILRTLRPRLPDALFATNNLDARFEHPDEWAETHNLLVASNYALIPNENDEILAKLRALKAGDSDDASKPKEVGVWRSEAPPFRDSLQAAVYAAARICLQAEPDISRWVGHPLLFEIGRQGPVRLAFGDAPVPEPASKATRHFWKAAAGCAFFLACMARLLWNDAMPRKTLANPWQRASRLRFADWFAGEPSQRPRWHRYLLFPGVVVPAAILLSVIFTAWRYHHQTVPGEEPFAVLAGISIWPGDFLRGCVVLLAMHFVTKTLHDLKVNAAQLEREFSVLEPPGQRWYASEGPWWKRVWRNFWPQTEDYTTRGVRVDVRFLLGRYNVWAGNWRRVGRATLLLGLYVAATLLLRNALHEPLPDLPVRGPAAWLSIILLWVSGLSAVFVTFLVVDATELNCRAIRSLNRHRSNWHLSNALQHSDKFRFKNYLRTLEPEDCADYLDIEFIARRSDVVNNLVYYPFILFTLLLAARWGMTDDYRWSPAFLISQGANAACALYCAILLPIEAGKARQKSLERLRRKLFLRKVEEDETSKTGAKKTVARSSACALEQVISQIENMNRGAFVGIWEQPVLRALLVPSSSAGLWALLGLLPR